jgi:hypothetical protein
MNSLTTQFNASANWSIFIAPLFMMLVLDDIARRETRRRKRISRLERIFNEKAMVQSHNRYRRQVGLPPRRMPTPRL